MPAECRDGKQEFGNYSAPNSQHQQTIVNIKSRNKIREGERKKTTLTITHPSMTTKDQQIIEIQNWQDVIQINTVSLHHLAPKCRVFLYRGMTTFVKG